MVLLTTGDRSGRPDTSGVDPDMAEVYSRRMFDAVRGVKFGVCRQIHMELNEDFALYVVALDLFRKLCKQHGMKRGAEKFKEYSSD